ncbi:hypothetical protein SNE40_012507 [Patella caerulea]|uniref:Uncharacterized protein n=2 Tax=Patella caerulea TaxID=87958 RepID=A0AAN8JSJ8_PATCE
MNQTEVDKEALRQKRLLGFQKLRSVSFLQIVFGMISVIIGAIALYFTSANLALPYTAAVPVWMGILVILCGILGLLADKNGGTETEVSIKTKSFVICYFVICLIMITFCILGALVEIVGIVFCTQAVTTEVYQLCLPNRTGNLTMAVFGMIIMFVLFIFSIMGTCFFCLYGRSLGFKNRYDYAIERGYEMAQMQQRKQQQQQVQDGGYTNWGKS